MSLVWKFDSGFQEVAVAEEEDVKMLICKAVRNSKLSKYQKNQFEDVLLQYEDVFSTTPKIIPKLEHRIDVTDDTPFSTLLCAKSEE